MDDFVLTRVYYYTLFCEQNDILLSDICKLVPSVTHVDLLAYLSHSESFTCYLLEDNGEQCVRLSNFANKRTRFILFLYVILILDCAISRMMK